MKCEDCRYFEANEERHDDGSVVAGACHRYPMIRLEGGNPYNNDDHFYPCAMAWDWCGEFEAKVDEETGE